MNFDRFALVHRQSGRLSLIMRPMRRILFRLLYPYLIEIAREFIAQTQQSEELRRELTTSQRQAGMEKDRMREAISAIERGLDEHRPQLSALRHALAEQGASLHQALAEQKAATAGLVNQIHAEGKADIAALRQEIAEQKAATAGLVNQIHAEGKADIAALRQEIAEQKAATAGLVNQIHAEGKADIAALRHDLETIALEASDISAVRHRLADLEDRLPPSDVQR
jgi:ATP-dependent Clp protease adapter protein ClpS